MTGVQTCALPIYLTESAVNQADETIEKHELIKCAVQQGCPLTAREAVTELCAALEAEPVQCIGRRFVMYRPSKDNPRIVLED